MANCAALSVGNRIISIERVAEIVAGSQLFFDETGSGYFATACTGRSERPIGFCGHRRFEDGKSGSCVLC
ncbi:MAG: hypothetical protein OXE40_05550 [Gammaproteobacteria bacterium]|nr:hypothetical protein [Gammaproteobacteria bacterium]